MKITRQHYPAAKECKYTLNGQNIAEMRRTKVNKIAASLKLEPKGPKNETLAMVIARLNALEAPNELSEM
ncbi:MAG: hypothetical protein V3U60_11355 [Gammaproteobacteria bacterium]